MTRPIVLIVALIVSAATLQVLTAQQTAAPNPAIVKSNSEMAAAALKWWNALSPDQQAKANFEFTNDERKNWAFTPVARKGLPWKDMTPMQRELGQELVKTGLSAKGYEKADATQKNEGLLGNIENAARAGSGNRRDPLDYYISIFGKPGGTDPWGWRFEGHHLAFNFTIAGSAAAEGAPNFFGSNPAKIPEGRPNAGMRVLAAEEDLGRALVKALNDEQRKTAIFTETAPREIVTTNAKKVAPLDPVGISAAKLTADQQKMLRDLIGEYMNRLRPELAKQNLDKINAAGFDKVMFGWAGTMDVGGPHYYRVQGPTFLIEYDNTQNNNNHIHAVWRDFNGDFGEDILANHYKQHPH